MRCPLCGGKTKVNNVRNAPFVTKRVRECTDCLTVTYTIEQVQFQKYDDYILKKLSERRERA